MPYLKKPSRADVENDLKKLGLAFCPANGAELNYIICGLINNYLQANSLNYANVQEMIGAIDCAKMEIYRRVASPYEDKKIEENGDVFTL
jgi:hypothetical protein